MPLSAIGYYFYSSTIASMKELGKEQGINSIHTAESMINNLGDNLLSIAISYSKGEDYQKAIREKNIIWIQQNLEDNLVSISDLDFVVTTDHSGNLLSVLEKNDNILQGLDYSSILNMQGQEKGFSGLIKTSEGIAVIAAYSMTDDSKNAAHMGNLIIGRLLNQEFINNLRDILHVELDILTEVMEISGVNKTTQETLQNFLEHEKELKIAPKTTIENNTIVVHAYQPISDIEKQKIGLIYLKYPLTNSTEVLGNLKQLGISSGIISILLIIFLTLILKRRIVLPLKHFKMVLQQVASGSSINDIPKKIIAHAEDNILALFEQLHRLSYYDYLTDLPNRRYSSIYFNQAISKAKLNRKKIAVMYFDLDRFKNINDSLGHRTGDKLLKLVANQLKEAVTEKGFIARLGGDEFIIIIPELDNIKQIESIATEILTIFSKSFIVDDYDLFVTSSIGISVYPDDGESADDLFLNADVAMYRAKELGKNKFQFYCANLNSSLIDKLLLESMLRKAIEKNELYLAYQPKFNIETNEIIGMEALIRWIHPELGFISPSDFIPIAEETGLIIPVGEWVLRTACTQNKLWQEQGYPCLKVAVNISARQFQHEDIINKVKNVLRETRLDPKWLELEITESSIMHYADETVKTLKQLKEMGISVSIDDFGTGYSSMSYLKLFPIKSLKIDQSFIKDIDKSHGDLAIAKSVITLGHALNFEVVAEGVESENHLNILKNEKCDISQGYYHSPPVPAESFEKLMKEHKKLINLPEK